jgi:hypothetical protein
MIKSIGTIQPERGRITVDVEGRGECARVALVPPGSDTANVLEPEQARALAALLVVAAEEVERERRRR